MRTGTPRKLEASFKAAYDPSTYEQLFKASLEDRPVIFWFPMFICSPRGTMYQRIPGEYKTYLSRFEAAGTEGEQPEVTITLSVENS